MLPIGKRETGTRHDIYFTSRLICDCAGPCFFGAQAIWGNKHTRKHASLALRYRTMGPWKQLLVL